MTSNIIIVGHGRSGKDEAGVFFDQHLKIPYGGSCSWAALPYVAAALHTHPQIAWEGRHANRTFWKKFCDELRADDPLFLVKQAFVIGRVVTGVRGLPEIQAAAYSSMVQHILWIERPGTPRDATMDFGREYATSVIENNGTIGEFHFKLAAWADTHDLVQDCSGYGLELLAEIRRGKSSELVAA